MIRLPPDFKDFLRLLNSHRVEYLLIGGYAVAYHGYPRPTGDMDIWQAQGLERFGATAVVRFISPNQSLHRMRNKPHPGSMLEVD